VDAPPAGSRGGGILGVMLFCSYLLIMHLLAAECAETRTVSSGEADGLPAGAAHKEGPIRRPAL
jgi:hypothetical protein